jgi:lipopolysaccharide assembly outer membrane protein LptD (OstA)
LNIFKTIKTIYFIYFLTHSINPFSVALPAFFNRDLKDITNKKKQTFSNQENSLIFFDNYPKLVLNKPNINSQELEIQSDQQYQENNILYAKGNVVVTFKGNSLKADSLIYNKLNEKFDAFGNIKLIIGKQIFVAERISYDFKSEKGKLLKVKGLIKTNNLVENININSSDLTEISSTLNEIRKVKVLYTPDGVINWIFSTDELIVENNQWVAKIYLNQIKLNLD